MNWKSMSDSALSKEIGSFIKQNRLQQNHTQQQIAEEAGISRSTLSLLERGETVTLNTLIRVLRVLDLLYVMDSFKSQSQISPLQLAKLERKKRQRSSGKKASRNTESEW